MRRDADTPTDDGYTQRTLIMESAKEMQECCKFLCPDADLPATHERYVRTRNEQRGGQNLLMMDVGVRRKVEPTAAAPAKQTTTDHLDDMDDATLEVEAARVGVKHYPKQASRARRITAIREAAKGQ